MADNKSLDDKALTEMFEMLDTLSLQDLKELEVFFEKLYPGEKAGTQQKQPPVPKATNPPRRPSPRGPR